MDVTAGQAPTINGQRVSLVHKMLSWPVIFALYLNKDAHTAPYTQSLLELFGPARRDVIVFAPLYGALTYSLSFMIDVSTLIVTQDPRRLTHSEKETWALINSKHPFDDSVFPVDESRLPTYPFPMNFRCRGHLVRG